MKERERQERGGGLDKTREGRDQTREVESKQERKWGNRTKSSTRLLKYISAYILYV